MRVIKIKSQIDILGKRCKIKVYFIMYVGGY